MTVLYKKSANGSMMIWHIAADRGNIHILYGMKGGSLQTQNETISKGLQGRSIEQQAINRMESRINKQLDKGYRRTEEDAQTLSNCNSLNLLQPMLATQCKEPSKLDLTRFYIQYKYDGHRCLITKQDGKIVAYSRQGKWITSISHILQGMDLPEGWIVDGELYHHNTSLQTISSWVKREQVNTLKLKFIAYDLIAGIDYKQRYHFLKHDMVCTGDNVIIAPTGQVNAGINEPFKSARAKGYEGLILRDKKFCYEAGVRSRGLLKVKKLDQAYIETEFTVINVIPSKDDWGILICQTDEGKVFRASAPGNIARKREILVNKPVYIGEQVTIEFPNWTDEGKPFQPVALRFVNPI